MVSREPVLIVDDNAINLKLLRVAMTASGYAVVTASDADEALAALEQIRPGIILMDIQMPGIDGLELTRRLKADARTRDIIIVAITAYAMKGDQERMLEAGCDGYIAKPIDVLTLPAIVAGYLDGSVRQPVR